MKKNSPAVFSSLAASDTLFLPYTRKEIDPFLLSEVASAIGKEGTLLLPVYADAARLYASGKHSCFFAKGVFPPLEIMLTLFAKVIDGEELPGATLLVRLAVSRFFARYLPEGADLSFFPQDENEKPVFPTPDPAPVVAKLTEERRIEEVKLHGKKWLLYTANDLVNTAEELFEKEPAAYFGEAIAALLSLPDALEADPCETAKGRALLDATLPPKLFDANLSVSEADIDPHAAKSFIGAREAFWLRTDDRSDLLSDKNQVTAVTVTEDMTHRQIEEAVDADLHTACLRYQKPVSDEDAFTKDSLLSFLMQLSSRRGLALAVGGLTDKEDFAKLGKLYKRNRRAVLILPLAGLMKGGMPPKALIKLSKEKRVYFDITAVNDPMPLALFSNLFGTDKLLFGSDGKLQKNLFAFCRAAVDLHFTKSEIAAILYENAARIFLS